MEKPYVEDLKLKKFVDQLYRDNATVGSGSSADAVREELRTGKPVGNKFHTQKVSNAIIHLKKWLKNNPTASGHDKNTAENLIKDMENALKGE